MDLKQQKSKECISTFLWSIEIELEVRNFAPDSAAYLTNGLAYGMSSISDDSLKCTVLLDETHGIYVLTAKQIPCIRMLGH